METTLTLNIWMILLLVAVVGVGLYMVRRLGREGGRAQIIEKQMEVLLNNQTTLTERLTILSETQIHSQNALRQTMEQRLDQVSQRMGTSLTETATKTAESLGKLATRLSVIDEAQKNITELSGQVIGLQDVLANKQARGAFGEVQLTDLVTNALPPSAYNLQAVLSNGKRADCLILLPNPPGPIVVDAKFPLEAYYALKNADTEIEKKKAASAFSASILKHVADIASKYIIPGETAESALMFLPSEAVYAELHAQFGDVVQKSYRQRVWIVSPTTLMATLNTVRAVMKDVHMREQAGVIQAEVGKMMEDVARLDKRVGNLKNHFDQANKDISEIQTSADKINRRGHRIENVSLMEEDIAKALEVGAPANDSASDDNILEGDNTLRKSPRLL